MPAPPAGAANLEEFIAELMECGLEVRACGKSLNDCTIDEAVMIPGVERGSIKAWRPGQGQ